MAEAATKKYGRRHLAAVFIAGLFCGILLGLFAPAPELPAKPVQAMDPEPDYEMTAFWGSFDEIRLFRYYSTSDIPDANDIPEGDAEYGDTAYEYVGTGGPVDMGFGPCWEAMYREKPEER